MDEISRYNNCKVYNQFKVNKNFDDPKIFQDKIKQYRKKMKKVYAEFPEFSTIMPIIARQTESKSLYRALIKNGLQCNSKLIQLIYKTVIKVDEKYKASNFQDLNNTQKLPKIKNTNNIRKIRMINLNKTLDMNKKHRKLIPSYSTKDIESKIIYKKKNIFSFNNSKEKELNSSGIRLTTESKKETGYNFFEERKKINSFYLTNLNRSMDIIQKCEQEVENGLNMNKYINKYKKFSFANKLVIPDIKTVEEKKLENQANDLKNEIYEPILKDEEYENIKMKRDNIRMIKKQIKNKQTKEEKVIDTAIKLVNANYQMTKDFKKKLNEIKKSNNKMTIIQIRKKLINKDNINNKKDLIAAFHQQNYSVC